MRLDTRDLDIRFELLKKQSELLTRRARALRETAPLPTDAELDKENSTSRDRLHLALQRLEREP